MIMCRHAYGTALGHAEYDKTFQQGLSAPVAYLSKQDSLRFQVDGHSVALVVQEVFQPQELDSCHLPPVSPVYCYF